MRIDSMLAGQPADGPAAPQAVWDFHIGGYQVLDKYLKPHKGRVLSLGEINHLGAIADSLAFTIEQMAAIEKAYCKAFPERGKLRRKPRVSRAIAV